VKHFFDVITATIGLPLQHLCICIYIHYKILDSENIINGATENIINRKEVLNILSDNPKAFKGIFLPKSLKEYI
jgi:hypothetical protein